MVHLLCGYNAAGKSTLARRLARSMPAARFSLDERMIGRYPGLDYADAAYGAAVDGEREALWREALVVLADGADVVLDWNCWRRRCQPSSDTSPLATASAHVLRSGPGLKSTNCGCSFWKRNS